MALRSFASLAALTLPGLVVGQSSVYARPLDFVYARTGTKSFNYTDQQLLDYFDEVPNGITAMVPFLLNVGNPSQYESFINSVQGKNITIVPGVGGQPSSDRMNSTGNKAIAQAYRKYTDYIRLENVQGQYEMYGAADIQEMVEFLTSSEVGFNHIMMNPWPIDTKTHTAVPFPQTQVDASINQVLLDYNHQTYEEIPNPENWFPANPNFVNPVLKYRPTASILINYEDPPQQMVLTNLQNQNGTSEAAMNITINQIAKSQQVRHWIPPFDDSYNPIALGTWSWIAKELGKMTAET